MPINLNHKQALEIAKKLTKQRAEEKKREEEEKKKKQLTGSYKDRIEGAIRSTLEQSIGFDTLNEDREKLQKKLGENSKKLQLGQYISPEENDALLKESEAYSKRINAYNNYVKRYASDKADVIKASDDDLKGFQDVLALLNDQKNFFAEFKDANEYNEYINAINERDRLTNNYDLEANKKIIDEMEKKKNSTGNRIKGAVKTVANALNGVGGLGNVAVINNQVSGALKEKTELEKLKEEYELAKWYQDEKKYNELLKNNDFEDNSKKANSKWDVGETARAADYINGKWYAKAGHKVAEVVDFINIFDDDETAQQYRRYDMMTDDQVKTFNYIYNTQGQKKAQAYLDHISNELKQKYAEKNVSSNWLVNAGRALDSGLSKIGDAWEIIQTKVAGGLVNGGMATTGKKAFDTDRKIKEIAGPSNSELALAERAKNAGWLEGFSYDLIQSAPQSSLALIPIVGNTIQGVVAGANAYGQATLEGRNEMERLMYAAGSGVMEYATNAMLTGIGKGKLEDVAIKKITEKITKPIAKNVIVYGIKGLGEGTEEFVQEIAETAMRNEIFGENEKVDWSNAGRAFLLGMTSATIMNSPEAGISLYHDIKLPPVTEQSLKKNYDTSESSDVGERFKVFSEGFESEEQVTLAGAIRAVSDGNTSEAIKILDEGIKRQKRAKEYARRNFEGINTSEFYDDKIMQIEGVKDTINSGNFNTEAAKTAVTQNTTVWQLGAKHNDEIASVMREKEISNNVIDKVILKDALSKKVFERETGTKIPKGSIATQRAAVKVAHEAYISALESDAVAQANKYLKSNNTAKDPNRRSANRTAAIKVLNDEAARLNAELNAERNKDKSVKDKHKIDVLAAEVRLLSKKSDDIFKNNTLSFASKTGKTIINNTMNPKNESKEEVKSSFSASEETVKQAWNELDAETREILSSEGSSGRDADGNDVKALSFTQVVSLAQKNLYNGQLVPTQEALDQATTKEEKAELGNKVKAIKNKINKLDKYLETTKAASKEARTYIAGKVHNAVADRSSRVGDFLKKYGVVTNLSEGKTYYYDENGNSITEEEAAELKKSGGKVKAIAENASTTGWTVLISQALERNAVPVIGSDGIMTTKSVGYGPGQIRPEKAVDILIGHELVHFIKRNGSDGAKNLYKDVIDMLSGTKYDKSYELGRRKKGLAPSEDAEQRYNSLKDMYVKAEMKNRNITRAEAERIVTDDYVEEEIAADYVGTLFASDGFINTINAQTGFFRRIWEWLTRLGKNMKVENNQRAERVDLLAEKIKSAVDRSLRHENILTDKQAEVEANEAEANAEEKRIREERKAEAKSARQAKKAAEEAQKSSVANASTEGEQIPTDSGNEATKKAPLATSEDIDGKTSELSENVDTNFLSPETDGIVETQNGDPVAVDEGNGTTKWSISTYEESGRDTLVEYLNNRVSKSDLSQGDVDDIMNSLDKIYDICRGFEDEYATFGAWSRAKVEYDTEGNPVFSVIKANGDYAMNLDFSLVCKKRRALDAVFNKLIEMGKINTFDFGQEQIVQINDIIRDHGFEVACAMCFVDAKRYRQAKVADDFVTIYNNLVKSLDGDNVGIDYFNYGGDESLKHVENGIDTLSDEQLDFTKIDKVLAGGKEKTVPYKVALHLKNNPQDRKLLSRGDFMSSYGFGEVKKNNPAILSLYNAKKGSGGPKAAFGDVQYLNDIIKSGKFKAKEAFDVGGVRIQSFSDYVARLVFDYAQMVADLSAKGLPAHAYTKEELFVKQFGLTGIKINMSLIPEVGDGKYAGLNADGSYAWAKESFPAKEAYKIQADPEYGRNCGTIAVGVSDEHIRKLLADPNIRMVIPYHKSGINPVVAHMLNIKDFTDYTKMQNTRYKDGTKVSKETANQAPNFNTLMQEGLSPVEASRRYVEWCEENRYIPKFAQFAYVIKNGQKVFNENYYKLLEDFTTSFNGETVAQKPVEMRFPDESSAFGSMKKLIQRGLEEDAITAGNLEGDVENMVEEISNVLGDNEQGKRMSMTASDADYLSAVENGDMEKAQRMVDEAADKAMPNSILREGNAIDKGEEAEGTLIKMFHGSGAKNFYTFEMHDGILGKGVYLTSNWDEAVYYAMEKLNIEESDDGHSYKWNGEEFDGVGAIGEALESEGYVRTFYANVTNYSDIATSSVYHEDIIALVRDKNQLKSADPVTYDDNGNVIPLSERFNEGDEDIRYSVSLAELEEQYGVKIDTEIVDLYSTKDYNNFGWARVNNIITDAENEAFKSLLKNKNTYSKTPRGERMLFVGDERRGADKIDNVILFTRGSFENPVITKTIRIDTRNETECYYIREELINAYKRGGRDDAICHTIESTFGGEILARYTRDSTPSLREIRQAIRTDRGGKHHRKIEVGEGSDTDASSKISRTEGVKTYFISEADKSTDKRSSMSEAPTEESNDELYLDVVRRTEQREKSNNELSGELIRKHSKIKDGSPVQNFLRAVIREYGSEARFENVDPVYKEAFNYIYKGTGNKTGAEATEMFRKVAEVIYDGSVDNELRQTMRDIRSYEILVPEEVKSEFKNYGEFFKNNFGRLQLRNETGKSISEVYSELLKNNPELFSEDVTDPADQLRAIGKTVQKIREDLENREYSALEKDVIEMITEDLIRGTLNMDASTLRAYKDSKTTKSRYMASMEKLRALISQQNEEFKEKMASKDEKQKLAYEKEMVRKRTKDIAKALFTPTKKHHVPEDMRNDVAWILKKIKVPGTTTKDIEFREELALGLNGMKIGASENGNLPTVVQEYFTKHDSLELDKLDSEKMHELSQMLRALNHAITTADKLFHSSESASAAAMSATRQIEVARNLDSKLRATKWLRGVSNIIGMSAWDPEGLFNYIGVPELKELYQRIAEGQDVYANAMTGFTNELGEIVDGKIPEEWRDETIEITVSSKRDPIKMTGAQIMSLYLLSKQADSRKRLLDVNGGIEITEKETKTRKRGLVVKQTKLGDKAVLTQGDLDNILSNMDEKMTEVADKIGNMLRTTIADKLNEVSLVVDGYKRFTVNDYFPMMVSDGSKPMQDLLEDARQALLTGKSFTFDRTGTSGVKLVVDDIFSVMDRHILGASQYIGYEAALRDFMKVYEGRYGGTKLKKELSDRLGREITTAIDNFIKGVQGKQMDTGDETLLTEKLFGNYKAAAVALNMSVVAKQPISIVRAMPEFSGKGVKAMAKIPSKADIEEMVRESGLAAMKSWGFSENTNAKSVGQLYDKNSLTWRDKMSDFPVFNWAEKMDMHTWGRIWLACKAETDSIEEARDKFNDVIRKTQVVNTALTSSPVANRDFIRKLMFAFKNEPLKTFNYTRSALQDFIAGKEGSGKHLAKVVTFNTLNSMLVAAITTAFSLMRDEEDDDLTIEKTFGKIKENMVEDLVSTMTVFAGDVYSAIDAAFNNRTVERADLAIITDTVQYVRDIMEGRKESKSFFNGVIYDGSKVISSLTGLPINTVLRSVKTTINNIVAIADDPWKDYNVEKWFYNVDSTKTRARFKEILTEALNKDYSTYVKIKNDLIAHGYDQKEIDAAVKNADVFVNAWNEGREAFRNELDKAKKYDPLFKTDYVLPMIESRYKSLVTELFNAMVSGNQKQIDSKTKELLAFNNPNTGRPASESMINKLVLEKLESTLKTEIKNDLVAGYGTPEYENRVNALLKKYKNFEKVTPEYIDRLARQVK